jgi:mRNA deadenylase 3'-5' endonuclease subunit Ccr4
MAEVMPTKGADAGFTVVCWNVLAHVHTRWNAGSHGGADKTVETAAQRDCRHVRITQALNRLSPDIALLQEVDTTYMPMSWQEDGALPCGEWLKGYTPYRSYTRDKGDGCVVLLKQAVFSRDARVDNVYIPGTMAFGWKAGVVVHARRVGVSVCGLLVCPLLMYLLLMYLLPLPSAARFECTGEVSTVLNPRA